MRIRNRSAAPWAAPQLVLLLVAALALAGCGDVQSIRRAQDAFNKGAELDIRLQRDRVRGIDGGSLTPPPLAQPEPGLYYAEALEHLRNAEGDARLKADGLLGTKLTIEALALWKTGRFQDAIDTGNEALEHVSVADEPRDYHLLKALPGLVKADEIAGYLGDDDLPNPEGVEERIDRLAADGFLSFNNALRDAGAEPIRLYILEGKLTLHSNYIEALKRYDRDTSDQLGEAMATLRAYYRALSAANADTGIVSAQVLYWADIFDFVIADITDPD